MIVKFAYGITLVCLSTAARAMIIFEISKIIIDLFLPNANHNYQIMITLAILSIITPQYIKMSKKYDITSSNFIKMISYGIGCDTISWFFVLITIYAASTVIH